MQITIDLRWVLAVIALFAGLSIVASERSAAEEANLVTVVVHTDGDNSAAEQVVEDFGGTIETQREATTFSARMPSRYLEALRVTPGVLTLHEETPWRHLETP